jgi:predicted transcriptional regulator
MMSDNPRTVLMSIRAEYANEILAGCKTAEFRRRPPKIVDTILIYRSGGDPGRRGIVGAFTPGEIVSGTALDHIREVSKPGIGLRKLEEYAGGTSALVWRIDITELVTFRALVPLRTIGMTRGPQSWQYITDEQADRARNSWRHKMVGGA